MKETLCVLVVEDHGPLREQIAALLTQAGFRVEEAADGRLALRQALQDLPDVLVLDLGLPGIDGFRLCRELRQRAGRHIPVLMLTARDTLPDKLEGFAAGTDDYLVKPCANEELLVRVRALARRGRLGQDVVQRVGSLSLDGRSREAWRKGHRLALPPTAFALLELLVQAWPRALTRSEILRRLWDGEPPGSDPLRTHLSTLRQQLDRPFDRPMLVTVHGVGLRLEADE
jgi:DNA-binding response OmpR family regulator